MELLLICWRVQESTMVMHSAASNEPIPGYTLLGPLGQGGFGEVWRAEAPGGIPKAIKFVKGNLNDKDGKVPAAQELKALNRVKDIHHPFILGIERVDIVDGQLVIVMELADRNLYNRLLECQSQGLPGIPRSELLRYMEEAAEALDLMNRDYNLQHLDIKPQNLFLVHNHLKIADFGLVKDLHGMTATVTSGITPLYAAPELFEGKVTCWCDQYSLAIVYQELLTGVRPFRGKNPQQLLMQHLRGTPDLSPLPEGDREIIGRALSKTPADHFGCCSDLLQALRAARVLPATGNSRRTQEIPCIRNLPPLKSPDPGEQSLPRTGRPISSNIELPAGRPTQPDIDLYGHGASARAADPPRGETKSNLRSKTIQVAPSPQCLAHQDVPCPRCGAVLIDPGPLQWCAVCGHGTGLEPEPLRTAQSLRANSLPVSPWLLVVAAALAGVVIALLLIMYGVGR